jgi:hypothetical protein
MLRNFAARTTTSLNLVLCAKERDMNWEAIGAIGELIGAIGVIATLVYLAVQIRRNTIASRATTYQAFNSEVLALRRFRIENPELECHWALKFDERESLSESDRAQFDNVAKYRLQFFEGIYVQTRRGVVEDEAWLVVRHEIEHVARSPGFSEWWEQNHDTFTATFQVEVERMQDAGT